MLLILKPLSLIPFSASISHCPLSFAFCLKVVAFIDITIFKYSASSPIRLTIEKISSINSAILEGVCTYNNLLSIRKDRTSSNECKKEKIISFHLFTCWVRNISACFKSSGVSIPIVEIWVSATFMR